jgi:hypothetical protein
MKYPTMPFSISSFEDATSARVGVSECLSHDMLHMYPVLTEKSGEFVAQFKATVVLLPAGSLVLNDFPFDKELYETTFKIEDKAILELLNTSLDRKKTKKDKKEAKKDAPKVEAKAEPKVEAKVEPKAAPKAEEKKDIKH